MQACGRAHATATRECARATGARVSRWARAPRLRTCSAAPQSRRSTLRALVFCASGLGAGRASVRAATASLEEEGNEAAGDALSAAGFFTPPTRVTAPGRVVALGDLHGDLAQARGVACVPLLALRQKPCTHADDSRLAVGGRHRA